MTNEKIFEKGEFRIHATEIEKDGNVAWYGDNGADVWKKDYFYAMIKKNGYKEIKG